jgi:hypothetical protein
MTHNQAIQSADTNFNAERIGSIKESDLLQMDRNRSTGGQTYRNLKNRPIQKSEFVINCMYRASADIIRKLNRCRKID